MPEQMTIEPATLKHLANAAVKLRLAADATQQGFVSDYCENALREVQKAMRCAIGDGDTSK